MNWEPLGSRPGKFRIGVTYRMVLNIAAPYNDATIALVNAKFRLFAAEKDVQVLKITTQPPMFAAHSSQRAPWVARLEFTPAGTSAISQAGLDPRVLVTLASVVVVVALSFALIGEPAFERALKAVHQDVLKPVFNPLTLIPILVVVVIVAIATRPSGGHS